MLRDAGFFLAWSSIGSPSEHTGSRRGSLINLRTKLHIECRVFFWAYGKITLVSHCSVPVKDTCQCTCPDSLLYAVRCQPDHSPHCALLTRSPWCFVDGSQDRISHDPKKLWRMILDVEGIPISNSNAWLGVPSGYLTQTWNIKCLLNHHKPSIN